VEHALLASTRTRRVQSRGIQDRPIACSLYNSLHYRPKICLNGYCEVSFVLCVLTCLSTLIQSPCCCCKSRYFLYQNDTSYLHTIHVQCLWTFYGSWRNARITTGTISDVYCDLSGFWLCLGTCRLRCGSEHASTELTLGAYVFSAGLTERFTPFSQITFLYIELSTGKHSKRGCPTVFNFTRNCMLLLSCPSVCLRINTFLNQKIFMTLGTNMVPLHVCDF
jgi:hypothetical protein